MFTGIIDSTGTISRIKRAQNSVSIAVKPTVSPYQVIPGDSVSVNGVCLTVESSQNNMLDFTAVYTTLSKTTLADIAVNSMVNLERALTPSTRMGGHFVLGHVDGCGRVVRDTPAGNSVLRTIWIPAPLRVLAAPGGSVAIDGVSLTIAQSDMETITVSLIPYTLSGTTLGFMKPGCQVNVECDVLARYLHHMQKFGAADLKPETGAAQSEDFLTKLQKAGF